MSDLTPTQKAILCSNGWLATRSRRFQRDWLALGGLKLFEAGEVIYERGKICTHVHGLIDGQIDVHLYSPNDAELVFPSSAQGKWYNFADVITQEPAVATAVARRPTFTQRIPRREFLEFLRADPSRYEAIIGHEAAVRKMLQKILAASLTCSGVELVCRRLILMLENERIDRSNAIAISQRELAAMSGVSPPTVQRAVRELKKSGILETRYGKIVVKDPQKLTAYVENDGV